MKLPIIIREAGEGDLPLILNSWLKSYRNAPAVTSVPNDLYFDEAMGQKGRILKLLGTGHVLVACHEDEHDIAYGWTCVEHASNTPPVVHYTYVKQPYRRQGICRSLLKAAGCMGKEPFWATHETPAAKRLGIKYVHNPFFLNYEVEYVTSEAEDDN